METIAERKQKVVQAKNSIKETFPVTGISCASCAVSVESMLGTWPGITSANVNYATQSVQMAYKKDTVNPADMQEAIQSVGYNLIITQQAESTEGTKELRQRHYEQLKRNTICTSLLAFPMVVIVMFGMDWLYANFIMLALTTPMLFWFGREFFTNTFKQARYGKANMDTLVALSTGIAYLFSTFNTLYTHYLHNKGLHPHAYFEDAAVIVAFILPGRVLEERAKSSTSSAIKKLIGLQPKTVPLIEKGNELEIPIAQVAIGNRLLVRPGEKIPVAAGLLYPFTGFLLNPMIAGAAMALSSVYVVTNSLRLSTLKFSKN